MKTPSPILKLLVLVLVTVALGGCQNAATAGYRIGEDSLVVVSSPLNIPIMAGRDAATNFADAGVAALLFPVTFPMFMLEHTILTTIHAVDLVAFPVHFFHDSETLGVYEAFQFPMGRGYNSELLTQGVGAGAIVALMIGIPIGVALVSSALQQDLLDSF